MARATEAEVNDIISTTLTLEEITPFLRTADTIVDNTLSSENYGTETEKQIVIWLAAHLVAIRDPRKSRTKIGDGDDTYQGKTGMGLNHTSYGQQVMLLDHHGVLAAISSSKRPAKVEVLF